MTIFLSCLGVLAASGVGAFLLDAARRGRLAMLAGAGGAVAGAALGLCAAAGVLAGGPVLEARARWPVPLGELHLEIDRLSAFFLVIVLGLSACAAVYGAGYLAPHRGKRALGPVLLFFNALVITMSLVVTARDGVLFLFAWEMMAVAAFLLVSFEAERAEVRRAALTYLVLAHISSSFLLVFFTIAWRECGSLDFARIAAAAPVLAPGTRDALFLLAVAGFGTKAGIFPLHTWLPEAHPAAPTHVSAVMSGVIVKTAICALLRGLGLLGAPHPWWGYLLLALGAASGLGGVLYALAQHDLKRLLAYHSIENVGIIVLGIGTAYTGLAWGSDAAAALGFAGALLHSLNHGIFKGLLFYGAGAVLHATHSRAVEGLGGLARRMPWTGATFIVGAAAISGLPPLNGFASEWLVYAGAVRGASDLAGGPALVSVVAVAVLAAIGGLCAACFAKAVGAIFLGEPRTPAAERARDPGLLMRAPMAVLALLCVAIGVFPHVAAGVVLPIGADLARLAPARGAELARGALDALRGVSGAAAIFLAVGVALALLRLRILAQRPVAAGATWGCGYPLPTPRMQYTASSFADPLVRLARSFLRPAVHAVEPAGYFPGASERETHVEDFVDERIYRPAARLIGLVLASARWLQRGTIHLYLLYLLVTVVGLLLWQLVGWR